MCRVCQEGDLGNYIQVSKLGQMFLVLPAIIASTIFPQTAAGFKEQVKHSMQILSRMIFVFYLIIIILLAATGYRLFPFVFGPTFEDMYAAFLWLSPGILSLSILAFLSAYHAGKNLVIINLTGAVIALVIIVIGDLLLIPRFGIIAAAQVSSVGYLSNLAYSLYHFIKEYKVGIGSFFILRRSDISRVRSILKRKA
jgi:O-antigen/teichoic acid export membrane protein